MNNRAELVADFRQYYALDLPLDSDELKDFNRLALLHSQLPPSSRIMRKHAPALEWSNTDYLLWQIEFNIRSLQWSLIDKKGRQGQKAPKPLTTPQEHAHNLERKRNAENNKAEINKLLGIEG